MSAQHPASLPQFMRGQMPSSPLTKRGIWCVSFAGLVLLFLVLNHFGGGDYIAKNAHRYASSSVGDVLMDSILNETLGFQKIFVINMKSRTDRRDGMALAASLTGMQFHFIESSTSVENKTLPPGGIDKGYSAKHLGSWRSHLNTARYMVENNIQSALVLEDDVDWDLHIHTQMQDFARASQLLLQPLVGLNNGWLDPTHFGDIEGQNPREFFVSDNYPVQKPTTSPYGDLDNWDLLWLGHCGATLPSGKDGEKTPLGRAVMLDDPTVVNKQHISIDFGEDNWRDVYPPFTRLVFRTGGNVCSLAYALSLQGARKVLYELGIRKMDAEFDVELESFCRGRNDRPLATCLSALPQYFQHHRPVGRWSSMSEINEMSSDFNSIASTSNIRHPTRVNLPKLVNGDTDWIEPYKDDEPH